MFFLLLLIFQYGDAGTWKSKVMIMSKKKADKGTLVSGGGREKGGAI